MWSPIDSQAESERQLRSRILAFIDRYCGSMTLQDAREWYAEAFLCDPSPDAPTETPSS